MRVVAIPSQRRGGNNKWLKSLSINQGRSFRREPREEADVVSSGGKPPARQTTHLQKSGKRMARQHSLKVSVRKKGGIKFCLSGKSILRTNTSPPQKKEGVIIIPKNSETERRLGWGSFTE